MRINRLRLRVFWAFALLLTLNLNPVFAQAHNSEVSAKVYHDLVRFAAQSEVEELRVEVFSPSGERVFDSNFVKGKTYDWPMRDLQGKTLASGIYGYNVTVKRANGTETRHGNLIIDQERSGLSPAPATGDSGVGASERSQEKDNFDVDLDSKSYTINTPVMGVGAANPLTRLHVGSGNVPPLTSGSTLLVGDGATAGVVLKSNAGGEMLLFQDTTSGLFGTVTDHPLGIKTNNLNRVWITADGNVGINTLKPTSPLTVDGMVEITSGGIKFPDGTIQTSAAGGAAKGNGSVSGGGAGDVNGAGAGKRSGRDGEIKPATVNDSPFWSWDGNAGTNSNNNFLGTTDNQALTIRTNNLNRMWVTGDGNVGIGALPTDPTTRLQVSGGGMLLDNSQGFWIKDTAGNKKRALFADTSNVLRIGSGGGAGFNRIDFDLGNVGVAMTLASGRLGIGTLTPDRSLTLANTSGANYMNVKDGTREILMGVDPAGGIISTMTNHDLSFRAGANSEKMRIASNGNIGIGTTIPVEKFDVASGRIHIGGACGGAIPNVQGAYLSWNQICGLGETDFINHRGGGPGGFAFMNTTTGPSLSTLMVLSGNGDLGIGTQSPAAKLHISDIQSATRLPKLLFTNTTFSQNYSLRAESFGLQVRDESTATDLLSFIENEVRVAVPLALYSDRTRIMGFDDAGCHHFGPEPDTDLAFGICKRPASQGGGYEFRVNGVKNFVQAHPTDATKEIVYVSLEGPEAGTYIRGTAKLHKGEAVIKLPEHFSLVTSDDGITVQLTPKGKWLRLYTVKADASQIVVQEQGGETGDFDYLVQGVRKGLENHQVIQPKRN